MRELLTNTGERIQLVEALAQGGEGEVWKTSKKGYLAKIYKHPTQDRIDKLQVMLNYPPRDPNADRNHVSFAWPLSLLEDAQGNKVGFLMPGIEGGRELLQVYTPRLRKREKLEVDWRFLHVTALNIASIIQALHQAGYVLGDIKPQNILVNNRALPSIIDTDSFQVRDPVTGKIHRCPVASESYTPVELLGKDITQVNQDETHDRFRLAVIIHCLLFGNIPFQGEWVGQGDAPEPTELVKRGWWPYAQDSLIKPSNLTIPLDVVSPELKSCFLRAFNEGHQQPSLRPSAGKWREVLNDAVKQLKECPDKTLHVFSSHWGECYWCQRTNDLGIDIFYGKDRPYPPSAEECLERGNNYYKQGNLLKAIDFCTEAIRLNPNLAKAYQSRGFVHQKQGNLAKAVEDYTQAIRLNPNETLSYNNRGNVYVDQGNLARAINDYNQAIRLNPNYANAYYNRGVAYKKQGKLQEAIEDYTQVIKVDPDYANAYFNRALAYDKNGNLEGAIQDYTQAIRLNPDHIQAHHKRGLACSKLGKLEQAIDSYTQAIQIDSNQADIYNDRGLVYYQQGNFQKAINDYTQAIQIDPKYVNAYYNRGLSYYQQGNFQKAIDDYTQVIRLKSDDAEAYFNRGKAKDKLGNREQALKNYNQAIRLDPSYKIPPEFKARVAVSFSILTLIWLLTGLVSLSSIWFITRPAPKPLLDNRELRSERENTENATSQNNQEETETQGQVATQGSQNGEPGDNQTPAQGNQENQAQSEREGNQQNNNQIGCGSKPKIDFEVEVRPIIKIMVSPGGSVTSASIVRSSGESRIDRAALDFVRSCRFPLSTNGREGKIAVSF